MTWSRGLGLHEVGAVIQPAYDPQPSVDYVVNTTTSRCTPRSIAATRTSEARYSAEKPIRNRGLAEGPVVLAASRPTRGNRMKFAIAVQALVDRRCRSAERSARCCWTPGAELTFHLAASNLDQWAGDGGPASDVKVGKFFGESLHGHHEGSVQPT